MDQKSELSLADLLSIKEGETREIVAELHCLFCKETLHDCKRKDLFDHFWSTHNFHLGHPDNLVFIDDFLGLLHRKLHEDFSCLFCGKDFPDYKVLRLHMRKKKHFRIKNNDQEYHKFYLSNYTGSNGGDECVQKESETEDSFEEWKNNEDADGKDWDDFVGQDCVAAVCLFCSTKSPTSAASLDHMRLTHGFDIVKLIVEWKLDFFRRVKLINYIRRKVSEFTCPKCGEVFPDTQGLQIHFEKDTSHCSVDKDAEFFNDVQYLFPTLEDDALLTHEFAVGFDSDSEENEEGNELVQAEDVPDGLNEMRELVEKEHLK